MTDAITLGVEATNDTQQEFSNLSKKRVLIIEDLGEMRSMLKSLVTSMGYTNVDVESSGQSALKRILETQYDVVLSDYNLGGSVDGQQILEASRKTYSQDYSNIFIMITADTSYERVVSALEFQPDSYLVKPFPPNAFFRRFERVKKQKKVFEEINNARKENDYEKMEVLSKAVMKQYPHFANLCLKTIGESLYARGKYKDAKAHYARIIQKNEKLAWAHFGIALCELKLGTVVAAIKKLEHTIDLSRHFLSAYDLLADAYEDLGNLEEAQATILDVLKASPRSSDRVLKLAQLSMHMKDWTTAEHAYARLIRLTRETSHEKVDYYYDYLKCLTNLLIIEPDNIKINDKFKRILYRLRSFGKTNPIAMSNSYRVEIQHYLANKNKSEAIRSWMQWQQLMKSGEATQLTEAQTYTLKKRLGLL